MRRPCEICSSTEAEKVYQQRFSTMENSGLLSGYDVVVCQNCGFVFASNIPSQAEFDLYYKNMSKYEFTHTHGQVSANAVTNYGAIVDFIAPHLKSRQIKILDIGCATGQLLAVFKARGYGDVTGADPSPACARTARELYGIEVLTAPVSQLIGSGRSFDLVLLSSVLEHIRDASSTLQQIRHMLNAGGLLFIEVPDLINFATYTAAPFQQFSIEHINFFSPTSLRNLLTACGFSEVAVKHDVRLLGQTEDPSLTVLFRKDKVGEQKLTPDTESRAALLQYMDTSREVDERISSPIADLVASGERIIVWGVGTHTLRLLATSRLAEARVVAFVDSNQNYQRRELLGVPIIAPDEVAKFDEPILISSKVYQNEIAQQIRETLGCENRLITLY